MLGHPVGHPVGIIHTVRSTHAVQQGVCNTLKSSKPKTSSPAYTCQHTKRLLHFPPPPHLSSAVQYLSRSLAAISVVWTHGKCKGRKGRDR